MHPKMQVVKKKEGNQQTATTQTQVNILFWISWWGGGYICLSGLGGSQRQGCVLNGLMLELEPEDPTCFSQSAGGVGWIFFNHPWAKLVKFYIPASAFEVINLAECRYM